MGSRSVASLALILAAVSFPFPAGSEDRFFSFVFPCGVKKNMLCMTTQVPSGQRMFLLGDRSNFCRTETQGTMNFHNAMDDKVISRIAVGHCRDREEYSLAYGGESITEYRRYGASPIRDEELVRKVDTAIKSLKFYSSANEYFGNTLSSKPHLFFPIPDNPGIVVAQYTTRKPRDNMERYGPIYLYVGGEVREIAREATVGETFRLDGRDYMTYRSGCWIGCGIQAEVLVEFSAEGFRKVLIDGFFAT